MKVKEDRIMNNEKLSNFMKSHNGYISTKEIEDLGFSKMQIPKMIEDELIRKVAHGLYIDNKLIEDEFYILQRRLSNIVFSYNTAFYLLNFHLISCKQYHLEIFYLPCNCCYLINNI